MSLGGLFIVCPRRLGCFSSVPDVWAVYGLSPTFLGCFASVPDEAFNIGPWMNIGLFSVCP
jgi:hypothetical protein